MKIKLIYDSMCDIPEEINNKEFVEMIPLTINIDGKEYNCLLYTSDAADE